MGRIPPPPPIMEHTPRRPFRPKIKVAINCVRCGATDKYTPGETACHYCGSVVSVAAHGGPVILERDQVILECNYGMAVASIGELKAGWTK